VKNLFFLSACAECISFSGSPCEFFPSLTSCSCWTWQCGKQGFRYLHSSVCTQLSEKPATIIMRYSSQGWSSGQANVVPSWGPSPCPWPHLPLRNQWVVGTSVETFWAMEASYITRQGSSSFMLCPGRLRSWLVYSGWIGETHSRLSPFSIAQITRKMLSGMPGWNLSRTSKHEASTWAGNVGRGPLGKEGLHMFPLRHVLCPLDFENLRCWPLTYECWLDRHVCLVLKRRTRLKAITLLWLSPPTLKVLPDRYLYWHNE
jgi:hypothetical protein